MDLAIARAVNNLESDERVYVEAFGQELPIWMRILKSGSRPRGEHACVSGD